MSRCSSFTRSSPGPGAPCHALRDGTSRALQRQRTPGRPAPAHACPCPCPCPCPCLFDAETCSGPCPGASGPHRSHPARVGYPAGSSSERTVKSEPGPCALPEPAGQAPAGAEGKPAPGNPSHEPSPPQAQARGGWQCLLAAARCGPAAALLPPFHTNREATIEERGGAGGRQALVTSICSAASAPAAPRASYR
jgi:hypothetical protein